jgi:predicted PurR-regulated permease PerM
VNKNSLMSDPVRRWSTSTKRIVVVLILVLVALVLYRFRSVIPPLVIAFLVAFILDPIVDFLTDRLHASRGLATALVFVVLVLGMLGLLAAPVTVVPSIQRAVRSTQVDFIRIISDAGDFFDKPVEIRGYSLDLSNVYSELSSMLRSFVASVAQGTLDIAFGMASGAAQLIFVLVTTFYLVRDGDRIVEHIDNLAPPGYRDDFVRLRQQVTDTWNAFLRGQLLLGGAMVTITTVACMAVGLPYAAALGFTAGLMEFVPNLGPILALIPAVLVALFKGSTYLPLTNFWFAVVVVGLYVIIQQVEGNLLVPRILGRSLNLHPLVVLIGIIIGGSLAGILGMLLAAPTLATLRILGRYVFYRLYDRDPFAEPEQEAPPPRPRILKRAGEAALGRLQEKLEQQRQSQDAERPEDADKRRPHDEENLDSTEADKAAKLAG